MTKEEEQQYWQRIIRELRTAKVKTSEIAEAVGVSERQVWAYKAGERPRGMKAVLLHNLHLNRVLKPREEKAAA